MPQPDADPQSRRLALLLTICGAIGLAAVLLIEKIALIEDPTCSISPILSCGSVMTTPQAEAFGFPNPIIGVTGFTIVFTIGTALLAGATMRRWYWLGLQAGVTFGLAFVHWLIFQSLFRIGALCPYCMVVWAVTVPLFLCVTLYNLRTRTTAARRHSSRGRRIPRSRAHRLVSRCRRAHRAEVLGLLADASAVGRLKAAAGSNAPYPKVNADGSAAPARNPFRYRRQRRCRDAREARSPTLELA